jgi:hypothetical protein
MKVLRTPDERFETLPGYPFAPHYHQIAEVLRIHYLDEGRRGALTSANYMEEARCAVEGARILDQIMTLVFGPAQEAMPPSRISRTQGSGGYIQTLRAGGICQVARSPGRLA